MTEATTIGQPIPVSPVAIKEAAAKSADPRIAIAQAIPLGKIFRGMLIAGGATGAFFGIRAVIRRARRNEALRDVGKPTSPATLATQLKQAFDNDFVFGFGTDEQAVFDTLNLVPDLSTWRKVQREFKRIENEELVAVMQSELTTSEFNEALSIIGQLT